MSSKNFACLILLVISFLSLANAINHDKPRIRKGGTQANKLGQDGMANMVPLLDELGYIGNLASRKMFLSQLVTEKDK